MACAQPRRLPANNRSTGGEGVRFLEAAEAFAEGKLGDPGGARSQKRRAQVVFPQFQLRMLLRILLGQFLQKSQQRAEILNAQV